MLKQSLYHISVILVECKIAGGKVLIYSFSNMVLDLKNKNGKCNGHNNLNSQAWCTTGQSGPKRVLR